MFLMHWLSFRGRIPLGRYWLAYVLPLFALQWLAVGIDLALFGWTFHDLSPHDLSPRPVPTASAAEGVSSSFPWSAESGFVQSHRQEYRLNGTVSEMVFWASLLPGFAGMTKRWHDRGASGWWSLLLLVPVIGWIWMFISLCCRDGQRGPNRYGPDPLEPVSSGSA